MKRVIALLLCAGLVAPACATRQAARVRTTPQEPARAADRAALGEFARQLRIGSRVRVTIAGNRIVRGTLVKQTDRVLVIQPRARVAEPLIEVPFDELLALEQEVPSSGGTGRAIAIGAGVGAGAAIGVLFLLAAVLWGD